MHTRRGVRRKIRKRTIPIRKYSSRELTVHSVVSLLSLIIKVSEYFWSAPVLEVPGRTFPVDVLYLEDAIEDSGYTLDPESEYRNHDDHDDDTYGYPYDDGAEKGLLSSSAVVGAESHHGDDDAIADASADGRSYSGRTLATVCHA